MTHEIHDRDRPLFDEERAVVDRLREFVADMPGVTVVRDGFGHSVFKAGAKSFVFVGGDAEVTRIAVKADPISQDALVRQGPYYRTPYIGQHGWVSIDTSLDLNWPHLSDLVRDGYRLAAPKRLLKQLEASGPSSRT